MRGHMDTSHNEPTVAEPAKRGWRRHSAEFKSRVIELTRQGGGSVAAVALAVPLFVNLRRIRQLLWPTLLTLLIGGVVATLLGVALAWAFGAEQMILMTMAPKSVTSPIAMLVA